MTKLLQTKLYDAFPVIFSERDLPMDKSCMYWGITCDDGWYDIIYQLCKELQECADKHQVIVTAKQVKEKFGELKFYMGTSSDLGREELWKICDRYQNLSAITCEMTGGIGKLCIRGHLLKTLCKESAILLGFKSHVNILN